jgi:phage regulator Rha-like protein
VFEILERALVEIGKDPMTLVDPARAFEDQDKRYYHVFALDRDTMEAVLAECGDAFSPKHKEQIRKHWDEPVAFWDPVRNRGVLQPPTGMQAKESVGLTMANPAAVVKATFVDQIPTKVIDNGSCGEPVSHNEPPAQPPVSAPRREPALSSLDIAEVTGDKHSRVLELIQRFMDRRGRSSAEFAFEAETEDGQRCAVYELPKDVLDEFLLNCEGINNAQAQTITNTWEARYGRTVEQTEATEVDAEDRAFIVKVDEIVRNLENPTPQVVPAVDLGRVPAFYPSPETGGPVKTMSSLEIAELTGKQHFHVMRDIQRVLDAVGIAASKFGGTYRDAQGREQPCYHLPKCECDLLITGYSVPYRKAVIDRWHELEAKALAETTARIEQKPEESDYPALLRQASDMLLRAAVRLEEQKHKVEFYDRYVETTRLSGIKETAQALSRWTTFVRGRNKFSESPPYCRIPHR